MGGAGWKWFDGHWRATSATALLDAGIKKLIIDGGLWMHMAIQKTPACAIRDANGDYLNLTDFVQAAIEPLEILRLYGFQPVIVFDGETVDSKENTDAIREEKRNANYQKFSESRATNTIDTNALIQSFNIHGHARLLLIAALRKVKIDFIQFRVIEVFRLLS